MQINHKHNVDAAVARGFGDEWSTFRQDENLGPRERRTLFESYFTIFPWDRLPPDGGVGMDVGCGSGRWSMLVAPRVRHLHLLDASPAALAVARENLCDSRNVSFHHASVGEMPVPDGSLDFAFSLGVLHHVPDTAAAIRSVTLKLKPGAPFLLYLYYAFDNRPVWYQHLWRTSELLRNRVSHMPHPLRRLISESIAGLIYWPFARMAHTAAQFGIDSRNWPLAFYGDKSFYVMRTDAYDRFCTQLEQRFTRTEIERMMGDAGLEHIRFSDAPPYWCAVGTASARAR
jgi:SAM-dependent methyltransferase